MNIEQQIIQLIVQHLGVKKDEVSLQTSLTKDLNVDSLDLVDLLIAINEEFSVDIRDDQITKVDTVQDLIELVKSATNKNL